MWFLLTRCYQVWLSMFTKRPLFTRCTGQRNPNGGFSNGGYYIPFIYRLYPIIYRIIPCLSHVHPIISRVSTILLVMQDVAGPSIWWSQKKWSICAKPRWPRRGWLTSIVGNPHWRRRWVFDIQIKLGTCWSYIYIYILIYIIVLS